ncbi:hypothetical protein FDUTEX481_00444 [Tolypothrix sp. PCC 7601]|nr:hypothetical protein FDUTEX481_00444 [Tolypothrix sp. PCC 7601]
MLFVICHWSLVICHLVFFPITHYSLLITHYSFPSPQSPLPLIPRGGPEFPNPQSPVPKIILKSIHYSLSVLYQVC